MKSGVKVKRNVTDSMGLVIPIAIINWNGINDTIECIDSLLRMDNKVLFKAYILDNGSDNNEYEKLKIQYSKNPNIKILHSQNNLGFTHGNLLLYENIKTTKESSPYIALLNNDTIVTENWLSSLYEFAEKGKWDIVSSKMIKYYDRLKIDNLGHDMLRSSEIIPMNHNKTLNSTPRAISKENDHQNFGACGGAALYRISMLKNIGFFDPHFDTGYEDAELGLRAIIRGFKSIYCPDSIVYHKGGASIKKIFDEEYAVSVQRNILYTISKNYPYGLLIYTYIYLIFRNLSLTLVSILTLKPVFGKVVLKGMWRFIRNDISKALKSRPDVHISYKSIQLWREQRTTMIYDLYRIYDYLILRTRSTFEDYR